LRRTWKATTRRGSPLSGHDTQSSSIGRLP